MTQVAQIQAPKAALLRADIAVIIIAVIAGMGVTHFLSTASAPYIEKVDISTSIRAIPEYALLSFTRSIIALGLSYVFAIMYGTFAARSKTLEKILIPLLDVFQSLPVLAFLPGFVLVLISIFHNSRWGLEIACLLTIFTGQVWNLAFAYYESQRTLQPEFDEVAKVYNLTSIRRFFFIDLPNGYRPLIYNGMMSMAGGWFFLTTCEAFTLGNKDFRLPGLGSYLSETFSQNNYTNFSIGLLVLVLIIVGTDFLLWKPLSVWVTRFRDGDDDKEETEESLFLNLIRNTNIPMLISNSFKKSILFFFPKTDLSEEGATRRYLMDGIDRWETAIRVTKWFPSDKVESIKKSSLFPMLLTFAVGGLVFSLLPKIPALGQSMASLSNNDWFDLIHAVFLTGLKVLLVLFISTLWTVPVGLLLGLHPRLERAAQPVIQNLAAFPAPVLFPLIALLLYTIHLPAFFNSTVLMCIGSQWYILFNVIGGASRISVDLKLVTRIYKFNLWNKFWKLYFPAILPSLTTGWITAAGGAWNASIVAEIVQFPGGILKTNGIGAELASASTSGNYPRLVAAIICIVVALIILNRTLWHTIYTYSERVKD
jgi:NitT/TauT family transport system permease protein